MVTYDSYWKTYQSYIYVIANFMLSLWCYKNESNLIETHTLVSVSVDCTLGVRYISYEIIHKLRVLFLAVELNM